uniref:Uncharacterized protein n=2 Tax=viral metagenome TaxID=1070528 RepID=A0A6M3LTE4_9ZZZZ
MTSMSNEEDVDIAYLQDFYSDQCHTGWHPAERDLRYALVFNDVNEVRKAIIIASGQCSGMPSSKWSYACGIMRNWRKEKENNAKTLDK